MRRNQAWSAVASSAASLWEAMVSRISAMRPRRGSVVATVAAGALGGAVGSAIGFRTQRRPGRGDQGVIDVEAKPDRRFVGPGIQRGGKNTFWWRYLEL